MPSGSGYGLYAFNSLGQVCPVSKSLTFPSLCNQGATMRCLSAESSSYMFHSVIFFQRINLFYQAAIYISIIQRLPSFPKSKRFKETPITHSDCSDLQCEVQPWIPWWVKDKHAIRQDLYKRFTGGGRKKKQREKEEERGWEKEKETDSDLPPQRNSGKKRVGVGVAYLLKGPLHLCLEG